MPDSNELDNILNEIKQKNDNEDEPGEASQENNTEDVDTLQESKAEDNESAKDPNELISHISRAEEYAECESDDLYTPPSRKRIAIIVIAVIAVIAIAVATVFALIGNREKEPETTASTTTTTTTTAAPVIYLNPLTN